jgi:hypothetical protein
MWRAVGSVPDNGLLRAAVIVEDELQLEAPSEAENIVADYRHLGLTLGRHPLSLLRERLTRMRFIAATDLKTFNNGQLARRLRHCHRPPATRDRQRCRVRHPWGRNRKRQRPHMAQPGRATTQGSDGSGPAGRVRHVAVSE